MKRVLCLVLCVSLLLSLAGCGKPAAESAAATTAPAETVDPVEAALSVARGLMDAGELDAAEAVLAQAGEDARVAELRAEIDGLRGVRLEVSTAVESTAPEAAGVEIHEVDAMALFNGAVRFTLDYTAPKGVPIQLENAKQDNLGFGSGERETLIFEMAESSVKDLGKNLRLNFGRDYTLKVSVKWPGDVSYEELRGETVNVPLHISGQLKSGSCEIHSLTVQPLNEDWLIFVLDFTPSRNGLAYHVTFPDGTYVLEDRVTDQHRTKACFAVERSAIEAHNKMTLAFAGSQYQEFSLTAEADFSEFEIPQYAFPDEEVAPQPPVEANYWLDPNSQNELDMELHSCTIQPMLNGYVRIRLEYTAQAGLINFCTTIFPRLIYFDWWTTGGGREERVIYVPQEDFDNTPEIGIGFVKFSEVTGYGEEDYSIILPAGKSGYQVPPVDVNVIDPNGGQSAFTNDIDTLAQWLEEEAQKLTIPAQPNHQKMDTSMIQPLEVSRSLVSPEAKDGVEPYGGYWAEPLPMDADLRDSLPLAYTLSFSDETQFPEKMPAGFDPKALLEWGKNPGLNVDVLHQLGYTGKGATIAYIDQPVHDLSVYENAKLHYTNNTDWTTSMHGPSVLSLLAHQDIGTAPEAEVYYYAVASWEENQELHAQCLYQIIEQNKSLTEGEKITMVGFSDNIDDREKNADAFREAVKACEEAGIMVWFCGEYAPASFLPLSDKDNFENVVRNGGEYKDNNPELVFVPADGRTTTAEENGQYIYWSNGGYSWTMPYVMGLYAIVNEIAPSLTQDELRALIVDTAYVKDDMKIVNPVEFVAAALDGVGKTEEAEALRTAAQRNRKYFYAVMNKSAMTEEDIAGAEAYLKNITDATVLVVDSSRIGSADQLYTTLQSDHIQRGGTVTGVQLLGDPKLVPAFEAIYNVEMPTGWDSMGKLLTDLFYGNFENNIQDIVHYMPSYHFRDSLPIQLTPEWPVVRLPLTSGEFAPFFEKYAAFAEETGLSRRDLVNFDNPIFASKTHIDAMGEFLNRVRDEFGILNTPYRLYGNLLGDFPVTNEVLGGFTAENLTQENSQGIQEFLINGHGQKNNLDKCFFENGEEKRESLMNSDNMNEVLSENPYYLDLWTCNGGEDMRDNLTTTALKGQCVGVFSDTHVISNNGVDCSAGLNAMAQSNFYYFYLHYLNALDQGASRSEAFFQAQRNYANALIADSANGICADGNYQFGIMNLVGYHNFGLIEPSKAAPCVETTLK